MPRYPAVNKAEIPRQKEIGTLQIINIANDPKRIRLPAATSLIVFLLSPVLSA